MPYIYLLCYYTWSLVHLLYFTAVEIDGLALSNIHNSRKKNENKFFMHFYF